MIQQFFVTLFPFPSRIEVAISNGELRKCAEGQGFAAVLENSEIGNLFRGKVISRVFVNKLLES